MRLEAHWENQNDSNEGYLEQSLAGDILDHEW
jgi:hypothetical protein